jgi:hypothetical protein
LTKRPDVESTPGRFGCESSADCMPKRHHFIAVLILFAASLIVGSARAQSAREQRKAQQAQQAIEGKNPLLPKRTRSTRSSRVGRCSHGRSQRESG